MISDVRQIKSLGTFYCKKIYLIRYLDIITIKERLHIIDTLNMLMKKSIFHMAT
jgi:hypothetical protein